MRRTSARLLAIALDAMNRSDPAPTRYAIYTRQSVERLEDFSLNP